MWQGGAVFWTGFVKVSDSPLSVFLLDHKVGELVWVPHFCYRSDFKQFFDFVVDRSSALGSLLSSFLFDWFEDWIDIQLVAGYVDVNPWHVFRSPGERVEILF